MRIIKIAGIFILSFLTANGLSVFMRDAIYAEYFYSDASVDLMANGLAYATIVFWILFFIFFRKYLK